MDPHDFLRFTLDPARLAIIGALASRPGTVDEVAERSRQSRKQTLATLAALLQSGLATSEEHQDEQKRDLGQATREQAASRYALDTDALRSIARALPGTPPAEPRIGFGMTAAEQDVLGRFFRGKHLHEIPAARGKRLVVLERLSLEFEPGTRYAETEVNQILMRFHDDYATLRRYLVDEGLLDRESGTYWRSGGRVQ